jgi:mono/diheme cytochrome c family protein
MTRTVWLLGAALATLVACASHHTGTSPEQENPGPTPSPKPAEHPLSVVSYSIVHASGAAGQVTAVAGDAVALKVVENLSDGSSRDVSAGTSVTWTSPPTVKTLPPGSMATSPLPPSGEGPTAVFADNAAREDTSHTGVLYVLDAGKSDGGILVKAHVSAGQPTPMELTMNVKVASTPPGDATRGAAIYAANCAHCHGEKGEGSTPLAGVAPGGDMKYMIAGQTYDFPAAALNAASKDNVAGDADWNPAIFAVAARSDFDNAGVALRAPMPSWFTTNDKTTNAPLTTQALVDVFAWLKTQR